MSINERRTSFVPAGAACWPLATTPDWRGGRNGWWDAEAVWDFDAKAARYMAGGNDVSLTSLLAVSRASTHLLANASGLYQSFGSNVLARQDGVGAYIGAARTNLFLNSTAVASWSALGGVTVSSNDSVAPDGSLTADTVAQTATNAFHGALSNGLSVTGGLSYVLSGHVAKAGHRYVQIFFGGTGFGSAAYANFDKVTGTYGTIGADIVAGAIDLGTYWLLWGRSVAISNFSNTTTGFLLVSGPTAARAESYAGNTGNAVAIWAAGFSQSACVAPPLLTSGTSDTRLASDVTASGVTWFAPVDGVGMTEMVVPKWSHVGDGLNRPLFEYIKDANNYIRGYINASDRPALKIVTGGVTQTDTALSVAIATGRKPLVFGWSPAGGYVGDAAGNVATFGTVTLASGIATKRIGSSQAGNYLNDVLERITVYRLRMQANALALAAAA